METLKEYRNILLGHQIEVHHTDHKNLTCKQFNTDRVLRWRLILEEYAGLKLNYIQGSKNVVADLLSCLNISDSKMSKAAHEATHCMAEAFFVWEPDEIPFPHNMYPLSYTILQQEQQKDEELRAVLHKKPDQFKYKPYTVGRHDYNLIFAQDNKIVIPQCIRHCKNVLYNGTTIDCYTLAKPGQSLA